MKTKSAKAPKQSKRTANVKDIKPKKNPTGGINWHSTGALRNVSGSN